MEKPTHLRADTGPGRDENGVLMAYHYYNHTEGYSHLYEPLIATVKFIDGNREIHFYLQLPKLYPGIDWLPVVERARWLRGRWVPVYPMDPKNLALKGHAFRITEGIAKGPYIKEVGDYALTTPDIARLLGKYGKVESFGHQSYVKGTLWRRGLANLHRGTKYQRRRVNLWSLTPAGWAAFALTLKLDVDTPKEVIRDYLYEKGLI